MGSGVPLGHWLEGYGVGRGEHGSENAIPYGILFAAGSSLEGERGIEGEEVERLAEPSCRSDPATAKGKLDLIDPVWNPLQSSTTAGSYEDARNCGCERDDQEHSGIVAGPVLNS